MPLPVEFFMKNAWSWLVTQWNWPGAAAFAGCVLLAMAPVVWVIGGALIFWVYIQLPNYMLHQLEEQAGDRFRLFTNQVIGGGVEILSRKATFVINSLGVWGVDLLALYLAVFVSPGWGLMAMYLPLVNALGHIGQGMALRRYNPGLLTSLLLFLPCAGLGLAVVSRGVSADWSQQALGFAVAVVVHALIIAHVKRQLVKSRA